MVDVPWWARSPSPFTFIFWIVLTGWVNLQIRGRRKYKRFPRVMSFIDSIFIVGLVSLSFDSYWILFQGLRFSHLYPEDAFELVIRLVQNLGLFVVCLLNAYPLYKDRLIHISNYTLFLLGWEASFFALWFAISPNISYTDWTFGIRMGFGTTQILAAFFISHILGKLLQGIILISLFHPKRESVKNDVA